VNPIKNLENRLAKQYLEIFEKFKVVRLPEIIAVMWNPYATDEHWEGFKTYWLIKDAWIRFKTDGTIEVESFKTASPLQKETAEALNQIEKIPILYCEGTDIYEKPLEKRLMKEKFIMIPEELEYEGIRVPYNIDLLSAAIIESIKKWGKNEEATQDQIITWLTSPPPRGGGWLPYTTETLERIQETLRHLVTAGALRYDARRKTYKVGYVTKGTTPLKMLRHL